MIGSALLLAIAASLTPARAGEVVFDDAHPKWECSTVVLAATCLGSAVATKDGRVSIDLSTASAVPDVPGAADARAYVWLSTSHPLDQAVPEVTVTAVVDIHHASANVRGTYADAFGEMGSRATADLSVWVEHSECYECFEVSRDEVVVADYGHGANWPIVRPDYPKERDSETILVTETIRLDGGVPAGVLYIDFLTAAHANLGGATADNGRSDLSLDFTVREIVVS